MMTCRVWLAGKSSGHTFSVDLDRRSTNTNLSANIWRNVQSLSVKVRVLRLFCDDGSSLNSHFMRPMSGIYGDNTDIGINYILQLTQP